MKAMHALTCNQQTNALLISGYASLFDECDLSGDIVRKGAFTTSLLATHINQQDHFALPMLYGHDGDTPIGVWNRAYEDNKGLFVEGYMFLDTHISQNRAKLIRSGAVSGLSIGYKTQSARPCGQGRELFDIDLWEVSIVAFPMLRTARIFKVDDFFCEYLSDTHSPSSHQ